MDPEASDSDVSATEGNDYRYGNTLGSPAPLPPPPSKYALESSDAVQARLDELSRVEQHNEKKLKILKAKRQRQDEKIQRKREIQDKKINAVMEARARHDARIATRRQREDAAFSRFFNEELDREEDDLRKRLKRLKRGLPSDEPSPVGLRSISSTSMSPPQASLSSLPPPPKRHQVGPPGQPDSVNSNYRPDDRTGLAKSSLPNPAYYSHRDYTPRMYSHTPTYSTTPSSAPPPSSNGISHAPPPPTDRPSVNHLSKPASPLARSAHTTVSPSTPATASAMSSQRATSSSYDTRPPPTTTSSGFASVNPPASAGFATINSRPPTTATPPSAHVSLARPSIEADAKTPAGQVTNGGDSNRFHSYNSTPASNAPPSTGTARRTPSTTHPYQMSEAFANRHHHCERVDSLNRGIWTSYGVGGTQENPTGPATEMYLRCNHDGCSRIDWRTVHGLQCHIVKNHEQPKGTIGSLDKALERYGVPVKEVEEYERVNGRGSAGSMADPKNHKIKTKTKEALATRPYARKGTPNTYDPEARPAGYRPSPSDGTEHQSPTEIKISPTVQNGFGNVPYAESHEPKPAHATGPPAPPPAPTAPATSSPNRYIMMPGAWGSAINVPQQYPRTEVDNKKLQGDFSNAEPLTPESVTRPTTASVPPQPAPAAPATPTDAPPNQAPAAPQLVTEIPISTPNTSNFSPEDAVTNGTANIPPPSTTPTTSAAPAPPVTEHQQQPTNQTPAERAPTKYDPADVIMTGTEENEGKVEGQSSAPMMAETGGNIESTHLATDKLAEDARSTTAETDPRDRDLGPPSLRRSALQSPTMTHKIASLNTPASIRRGSRRSSVARKSIDEGTIVVNGEKDGDEDDRESMREKTPPRTRRRTRI